LAIKVAMKMAMTTVACFAVSAMILVAACSAPPTTIRKRNLIVTSLPPLGSILRNLAGDRFEVVSVVPERILAAGVLQPPPQIERLGKEATAGVFLGTLDSEVASQFERSSTAPFESLSIAELSPDIVSSGPIPWLTPEGGRRIARLLEGFLRSLDARSAEYFSDNLFDFERSLYRIEETISATASTLPSASRVAAGTTDGLRPFFEFLGFDYTSQESLKQDASLAEAMKTKGVAAFYTSYFDPRGSKVGTSRIPDTVEVKFQGALFDVILPGPAGSLYHTYFGLLIENARMVLGAAGADTEPLDNLSPVDIAP
jgi:ABC-type Zn uptake system ZnuABC Zn-binding protein ZnuA